MSLKGLVNGLPKSPKYTGPKGLVNGRPKHTVLMDL